MTNGGETLKRCFGVSGPIPAVVACNSDVPVRDRDGKVGFGQTGPLDLGPANGRNRRVSSVAVRPGEGRLTEPTAAARLSRQQRRPMPHTCRSQ